MADSRGMLVNFKGDLHRSAEAVDVKNSDVISTFVFSPVFTFFIETTRNTASFDDSSIFCQSP